MPEGPRRDFAAFLLSTIVLTLASNLAGYILHIYPVNLFFWMFVGFFCVVCLAHTSPVEAPVEELAEGTAPEEPRLQPARV